jgi:hypothetical protein
MQLTWVKDDEEGERGTPEVRRRQKKKIIS